jgi:predicted nucleic acid-binding protein
MGAYLSSEFPEAILDASVLVQILVREKYTDTAFKLVSMLRKICIPSLTLYEISNALVMLAFKNFITKEDAITKFKAFNSIPTLNIREIPLTKAMDIAIELKITLYDASYLALALEAHVPFITADEELYEKGKTIAKIIHISEVTS